MSLKRRLSVSLSPQRDDGDSTATPTPSNSPKSSFCLICGDKARFINYGALSCQSCKTFFRRNGFRPETVRPCPFDQRCEVNMLTRHNCAVCRLGKCFTMGMSSDLIRKEDFKKRKISPSTKSDATEQGPSQQITTTSLPLTLDINQDIRTVLNDSEWKLLSNILYAYDAFSIVSQVCHTIDNLSTSSIETDVNALNPLEIVSQIFTSIQSFIGALPDFRILTVDEQTSLFERNLHGIIGFYFLLFFRNTKILDNVQYMEAFTNLYGSEIILLAKKANDQLEPDSTLIKVMLVILAFSSHCFLINESSNVARDSLLHGTFRLFGSQNVYLELLWKYMIYRYGYNDSILRFSRLIQTFLCVSKTSASVYLTNESHQNVVDGVVEKIKLSLAIKKDEQTVL